MSNAGQDIDAFTLTDHSEGERVDGNASLNLVKPEARAEGLRVIIYNVGAHSQQVTMILKSSVDSTEDIRIIDLVRKPLRPAFIATGSYTASWELHDGELWIVDWLRRTL